MSPQAPTLRPLMDAPFACEPSSSSATLRSRQIFAMAGMSAWPPNMCTAITHRVRGPIFRARSAGSMFRVSFTSQITGIAPRRSTALDTATQKYPGMITSWPGPTPRACSASSSAPLPLFVAAACFTPKYAAASFSKCSASLVHLRP